MVVIVVIVRVRRDDLTPAGVPQFAQTRWGRRGRVALRALVVGRRGDLVLRPALFVRGALSSALERPCGRQGSAWLADGVLPDDVLIRPMREGEAPGVYDLVMRVLFEDDPNVSPEVQRARSIARIEHPRDTDPGGAWVAERPDGTIAASRSAIVRERLWGFSCSPSTRICREGHRPRAARPVAGLRAMIATPRAG